MTSFFFSSRRRHTSLTCDWSSDVCSSDLRDATTTDNFENLCNCTCHFEIRTVEHAITTNLRIEHAAHACVGKLLTELQRIEIGRASCRERVEISVVAA